MFFSDSLPPDLILSQLPGCDCPDICVDPLQCACLRRCGGLNYHADTQVLFQSTLLPLRRPIYECNSSCTCHPVCCPNRVVQHRVDDFSAIGRVETTCKGLGACAVRSIGCGEFVCVYRGLYINPSEAGRTSAKQASAVGHVYVLAVREFAGEAGEMVFETVVDGAGDGFDALPLSSLINHSCDPNLTVIPVRVDSLLPLLAFFARRGISKGEEVCYDYGERCVSGGSEKVCLCGSQACRGFLSNHD
ncbi:Histone-lysine N-methyltransferase SETMAR [Echinococcus granulosus]|nr:Histone-lysine N-methyltransferase SETMAR [Echinococcus granulosus]